jgi:hypothetical protein
MSDDPALGDDDPDPGGRRLRVYIDADVLFAGASSTADHSASQVLLTLSEVTLLEGLTSELAVAECRRNLQAKMPAATGDFDRLVQRALSVREAPGREDLLPHVGRADWKDLPHLVSSLHAECRYLATYNVSDYQPGHADIEVVRPGVSVRTATVSTTCLSSLTGFRGRT